MNLTKSLLIIGSLVLAGCSAANYQEARIVDSQNGHDVWYLRGYTSLGETKDEQSLPYINKLAASICSNGYDITMHRTAPTHNVAGEFLQWFAKARCK